MMLTMHSILRDKYKARALFADVFLLVSAVILNSLVFVDVSYFTPFLNRETDFNLYIGIFSVLIFAVSLIILLVNWKQKSENHNQAVIQLSELLNYGRIILEKLEDQESIDSFNEKYNQVTSTMVAIPDKKFNYLKSRHLRKVAFSKYLDKHGEMPFWLVKIKFFTKTFVNDANREEN